MRIKQKRGLAVRRPPHTTLPPRTITLSQRAELIAQTVRSAVAALQCPDLFRLSFLAGAPLSSTGVVILSLDAAPCRSAITASMKIRVRRHSAQVAVQYVIVRHPTGTASDSHAMSACRVHVHADTDLDAQTAWRARVEAFVIKALEIAYLHERVTQ